LLRGTRTISCVGALATLVPCRWRAAWPSTPSPVPCATAASPRSAPQSCRASAATCPCSPSSSPPPTTSTGRYYGTGPMSQYGRAKQAGTGHWVQLCPRGVAYVAHKEGGESGSARRSACTASGSSSRTTLGAPRRPHTSPAWPRSKARRTQMYTHRPACTYMSLFPTGRVDQSGGDRLAAAQGWLPGDRDRGHAARRGADALPGGGGGGDARPVPAVPCGGRLLRREQMLYRCHRPLL
jgi:hypothetical protein